MKNLLLFSAAVLAQKQVSALNVVDAILGKSQVDANLFNSAVEDVKNSKAISLTGRHTCVDAIKRL